MNKLKKYVLSLAGVLLFAACADDAKDPWKFAFEAPGAMVTVDRVISPVFNFADLNTAVYSYEVSAQADNIAKYELFASLNGSDSVSVAVANQLPATVSVTANQLATALAEVLDGFELGDFGAGDRVDFYAVVTRDDGRVFDANTMDDDVENPGMKDAFTLTTYFSCPFVAEDMVGDYEVIADDFEITLTGEASVEAGPGANQITIVGVFGHEDPATGDPLNMVLTVNPITGEASAPVQYTWDPGVYGLASFGKGYAEAPASVAHFAFSCSGVITMNLTFSVDIGSYGGGWGYTLRKVVPTSPASN